MCEQNCAPLSILEGLAKKEIKRGQEDFVSNLNNSFDIVQQYKLFLQMLRELGRSGQ